MNSLPIEQLPCEFEVTQHDNDDDLIALVKQRIANPEPSFKVNLDEI